MYIGAIPTPAATESRQEFTATANQTVFSTTGGTVGYCDCFLNGVKMAASDFSFDGADVTLTTGAAAGDTLAVVMRQADNALVALPIKDSAGNNVLSESGGVVTLAHDLITGNSSYGFAQLAITSVKSIGNLVWDTISGDTTNITKPNADHDIRLGLAGIYSISISATFVLSGEERAIGIKLLNASDDSVYTEATDSIKQADTSGTYGNASSNYVGYFPANSDIYFSTVSASGGNAQVQGTSHASIILLRRTA